MTKPEPALQWHTVSLESKIGHLCSEYERWKNTKASLYDEATRESAARRAQLFSALKEEFRNKGEDALYIYERAGILTKKQLQRTIESFEKLMSQSHPETGFPNYSRASTTAIQSAVKDGSLIEHFGQFIQDCIVHAESEEPIFAALSMQELQTKEVCDAIFKEGGKIAEMMVVRPTGAAFLGLLVHAVLYGDPEKRPDVEHELFSHSEIYIPRKTFLKYNRLARDAQLFDQLKYVHKLYLERVEVYFARRDSYGWETIGVLFDCGDEQFMKDVLNKCEECCDAHHFEIEPSEMFFRNMLRAKWVGAQDWVVMYATKHNLLHTPILLSLFAVAAWEYQKKGDKKKAEFFDGILHKYLSNYGIDGKKILDAWKENSGRFRNPDMYGVQVKDGVLTISELHRIRPGAIKVLAEKFGIYVHFRYALPSLIHQFDDVDDMGEYGVVIMPRTDYNGAFIKPRHYLTFTGDCIENNLHCRFVEVGDKKELYVQLLKLNKKYNKSGNNPIRFMVIGGHGSKISIELGDSYSDRGNAEKYSLLLTDFYPEKRPYIFWRRKKAISSFVSEDLPVVLLSCSTGAPGENIGKRLSELFRIRLWAPPVDTRTDSIRLHKEDGRIMLTVKYSADAMLVTPQEFNAGVRQRDKK